MATQPQVISATTDQMHALYTLSTLKLPLAGTTGRLLGVNDNTMRSRISALEDRGYVHRKMFGENRYMFQVSLAGQQILAEWLKTNEPPVFIVPGQERKPRSKPEPYQRPEGATPSRTFVSNKPYVPNENAYYRNDGNKHIKSRGIAC